MPRLVPPLAAVITGLLLLSGCSESPKEQPTAKPTSAPPTPIDRLNTTSMTLARIKFCDLMPKEAIKDAVQASKWSSRTIEVGQREAVSTKVTDVVSELGCRFTGEAAASPTPTATASGSPTATESASPTPSPATTSPPASVPPGSAGAWVFSRPVSAAEAGGFVVNQRAEKGCTSPKGPAFGKPTAMQVCPSPAGVRVRYAGLFGQTWLTCEVTAKAPRQQVRQRAGDFCVAVTSVLRHGQDKASK